MTAVWVTIAALTVGTAGTKVIGPLLLGHRPPGPRGLAVTALVAPALLAALVLYETFSSGDGLVVDARAAGLGAAVLAILARAPMLAVILIAAAATALVRALT
ncbi:MAG TPA: AzlD domain-containing protein [Solirubrobacter sp.]|nr:AzlD domain-containing protein [Solirubrobacter sp.]